MLCDICGKEKPLFKAIQKLFGFDRGWQEEIVFACQDCIEFEGLKEIVGVKETKKTQKAA